MDLAISLFFIAVALAVIGPFLFCFALYKWIQTKSKKRSILLVLACLFLPYSYFWYDAFYPSDSFYKEEFVNLTKIPFPDSGSIVKKSASYPDMNGDYAAAAQFQVSQKEFDELLRHFENNTAFSTDTTEIIGTNELEAVTEYFPPGSYLKQFSSGEPGVNAYIFVGFLKDRKTIIMHRASS